MRTTAGKFWKWLLRLIRHPGTPESVGRGVASGFFTALVLPFGHMAAAFLLAVLLRGARGTAVLATWIINPFTVPVVWPLQCWLGSFLIGSPLSRVRIEQMLRDVIYTPSLESASALSKELIFSFFAGGAVLGIVLAVAGYFCTVAAARRYQARRAGRKARWIRLEQDNRSLNEAD